ncbi:MULTISPECIES: dihydrolipoamide acetyltransferase family protein [Dermabacter]|uniref:Dihydrolipoamide acetyltransferase component of pyruvate dehydrogenase complex n=1 Tax=Dermabacter jinjuensis TaxID=1667168 RepID=A0ABN5DLH4_9MICO|nr:MULTISPECIES: dihydrolipoamide acetyltransferase family protein [Dermabacter]ATH95978.1 pyruvate dehydrogenase [Dermabacter jinjuensis]MCT1807132.1 2-oxo acid dehydrogenase subunit E2 [Dermabacter hominis]UEB90044.1 2-oxo acid dehydrogenase subunit E2 [Dermabacter jinjuensis]WIK60285.1 dihydrolipoamide acetyltransferase family protein [Dermabacter hominis]
MSSITQICLTDPGEGLTEAEIIEIKVKEGDRVEINDPVVTVETAKSAVELPSHVAGIVAKVHVKEGDELNVGEPMFDIETDPEAGQASEPDASEKADASEKPEETEPKTLVGYGARETPTPRRKKRAIAQSGAEPQVPIDRILAKPPVRKLAKDLGVALHDVLATGRGGVVTRQDVIAASQRSLDGAPEQTGSYFPSEEKQAPDNLAGHMKTPKSQPFPGVTSDEETTRVPIRSVRKRTAEAMVSSAFTAPHVTVFNEVDMTETLELLDTLKKSREWKDVKISPLVVLAKALLVAIRRNPEVNASWDEDNQEIVYKHFVNLGIAAATPRGLIVPNIKDAHLLTLRELAVSINDLAQTARAGQTPLSATRNGTITITNFGVFGIDSGTPILNPGESVILGFGAIKDKPWVVDGEIVPRKVCSLALSFDHRLIDGALGSELLRDVSAVLENPSLGLVWG